MLINFRWLARSIALRFSMLDKRTSCPPTIAIMCQETCGSSQAALIGASSFLRVIACWPQSYVLHPPADQIPAFAGMTGASEGAQSQMVPARVDEPFLAD
jgi:hypothetical protein